MFAKVAGGEIAARLAEVTRRRIEAEGRHHRYHAAGSFRDRRVIDEQGFPDQVRLLPS